MKRLLLLLVTGSLMAQDVPTLTDTERLKLDNAILRVNQIDAQILLLQERRARITEVELPQLVKELFDSRKLSSAEWQFDLNTKQFRKLTP